jgi:CubicO group peptidase (beta-lactamase class C family)
MKLLKSTLLLFFICCALLAQSQSQPVTPDNIVTRMDTYLATANKAYKFTGSALVAKGGKILLHKAYGYKDYRTKTANDTATKFPILSITKSFTAMVMLKLQEEGKLSLKDKLNKYFPGFPHAEQITLHHLITHSSGLYNFTSDIGEEDSSIVCYPVSKERVLQVFKDKPLDFKPGKGFSYNNSGFFLAGMVIEKVTGKAYEQVVRELIFEPLGMRSSGFDFINLPAQSRAMGYQFLNDEIQKPYRHYDSTVAYAAGSIYSTTGDMYKWAKAIAARQILSEASWKQAFKRQEADYGYGFFLGQFSGKRFIRHSGGYPGFMSEYLYYPDEDLIIILLNNYGNYDDSIWPIAMALTNIVFEKPYDLWTARKEVNLPETILRTYTGTFGNKKTPVTFFLQEGKLHCRFSNGGQFPLFSESETSYFLKGFNTSFRFTKAASGQVEKVIIYEHGQQFELSKLE